MEDISLVFQVNKNSIELLVFDESLENIETYVFLLDTVLDENECDALDIFAISNWILDQYSKFEKSDIYNVIFTNFVAFSSYLVCLDYEGKILSPICIKNDKSNHKFKKEFHELLKEEDVVDLGNLSFDNSNIDSGLQFYSHKKSKSEIYRNTRYALMLPEYLQFIFTHKPIASLSGLSFLPTIFDLASKKYLNWIEIEKIKALNIPLCNAKEITGDDLFGSGINNLIASIVPYSRACDENFLLLQTSDWNICWNPFNDEIASRNKKIQGVFNAYDYEGKVINGCKLYAGNEHDRAIKHLAEYFQVEENFYLKLEFDPKVVQFLRKTYKQVIPTQTELGAYMDSPFMERNLNSFRNYTDAYHQFLMDIIAQQTAIVKLILGAKLITTIFVEGKFSENSIFMKLLSESFIYQNIYACQHKNIAALGAVLIRNNKLIDKKVLDLKPY